MKVLVVDETGEIKQADPAFIVGRRGPAGADSMVAGPQGPVGPKGDQGPIGLSITGPMGARGLTGERGAKGDQGPIGLSVTGPRGPMGPAGVDGKDGRDGVDGKDGRNAELPTGAAPGDFLTMDKFGNAVWGKIPQPVDPIAGPGYRVRFNNLLSRVASLEAGGGGGGGGASSVYVQGLVAPLASSADVASRFGALPTWATSTWVGSNYQPIGNYANSADVSSFYALKTTTWATSTWVGSNYQPIGNYANSSDVSSFYALKTSDATRAVSADVSSFYALKTSLAAYATSADVTSAFAAGGGGGVSSAYVNSFYMLKAPVIISIISSNQITPSALATQYEITSLGANTNFNAPTGAPVDGQKLIIRIKDSGSAFNITWSGANSGYRAMAGVSLPTNTTSLGVPRYVGMIWNAQDFFWDVVAAQ